MSRFILRDPEEVGSEMLAAERGWPRYTESDSTPKNDSEWAKLWPLLKRVARCLEVGGTE